MSLKHKFAKSVNDSVFTILEPGFIIGTTIIMAGIAAGPGALINETLPMNDEERAGSQQAIAQYTDAIDALSSYKFLKEGAPPEGINAITRWQGKEAPVSDNAGSEQPSLTPEEFNALNHKFGTSVIVDTRLSEKDKHDLVEAFEENVGDFERFTSLNMPDFADIDESIKDVGDFPNETAHAEAVISESNSIKGYGAAYSSAGMAVIWSLMFLLVGTNRRRLKNWEAQKPHKKPPKIKH